MNNRYASAPNTKTPGGFRNRILALMALSCSLAGGYTAQAQGGCASASIAYSNTTFCATGNQMVMLTGTPGGMFSSGPGLMINGMTGTINTAMSTPGTYTVSYMIPADGSCPAVNTTASVTIMERPVVDPMPNIAVCAGTVVNPMQSTSSMAGVTFMWENDNTDIGLGASGTGPIPTFTAQNPTDEPRVAHISVYAMYTMNGVTCMSKPMRFTIFVNPTPTVNDVSDITVCNGGTVNAITFTGPTSGEGIRYNWMIDNGAIGLFDRDGYDMMPSFNAQNFTMVPQVATVTVTPVYINGSKCAGTPQTFTITVNPSAPGTASFTYGNNNNQLCQVGSVNADFTGPTGGTFTSQPGLVISAATGTINTSLSRPGNYTVGYTYNGGVGTCNFVNSTNVKIIDAGVSISYMQDTYCAGANRGMVSPMITGLMGGTFSAAPGLAINPTTGMIDLANSTAGNYNVTYSVTSPDCGPVQVQTQFNVVETPVLTPVPNRVICAGSTSGAISFNASDPGTSFTWTNSDPTIGLPATGNGNIDPFVGMNNTSAPVRALIRVVPRVTKNGITCFGKAVAFYITINPTYSVTPVPNQVYCNSDAATTPINFTNSSGSNTGVRYTWTNTSTSTGLALTGMGNIGSFNPTTGNSTVSVVATNSYKCTTTNPMVFNITVNPCGNIPGDTGGDGDNSRTALQQFESQVTTAPNPVSSTLKINYTGTEGPITVRLLDMYGQPLKVNRSFGSTGSIDMSALRPGNYVLQLIDERRNLTVQRNIIKL